MRLNKFIELLEDCLLCENNSKSIKKICLLIDKKQKLSFSKDELISKISYYSENFSLFVSDSYDAITFKSISQNHYIRIEEILNHIREELCLN